MTVEVKDRKEYLVADVLESLGFEHMAKKLKDKWQFKRKMALAYEHYRCITVEKLNAFQMKLQEETQVRNGHGGWDWKTLNLAPVKSYPGVPPAEVLKSMQDAKDLNCFDEFQIASIENIHDPLLFGRITGCPDYFFIAQWDNDIKIEDILKDNEG